MIRVPFHVPGYEKVQMAVVIVIEETRGTRPASTSDARFGGNIRKRSIAIVAVQGVLPIVRYEQIGKAIVVIVAHCYGNAVIAISGIGQPGGFRDVRKTSVGILAVQAVPIARIAALEILRNVQVFCNCSTIHKENIQETIVVVIEQG